MKSKMVIIPVVLLVAILGLFLYFKGTKSKTISNDMAATSQEAMAKPFSGTLKAAVELGLPMRCKYSVEGVEYEGIVKGSQYKGSVVTQDGKQGNIIMKENCIYSWEEGADQGVKMCYTLEEKDIWAAEDSEAMSSAYICNPAAIVDSDFDLPPNVEFLDVSNFMQGIQSQPLTE